MNRVTPQSFTMTPNASYIDTVSSQQNYSVGRICFISVTGLRFKAIPAAETVIFAGAPVALQYVAGRAFAGDGTGFRITNGSSGKILTSTVPGSTSITYSFTLTYILS